MKPAGLKKHLSVLCLGWVLALWLDAAAAAPRSDLSRWLGDEASVELLALLEQHPRFAGRELKLEGAGQNALTEAIAITLDAGLAGRSTLRLADAAQPSAAGLESPAAIDALDCRGTSDSALLTIQVETLANAAQRVELALFDEQGASAPARSWQWLGRLSRDEQRAFEEAPARDYRDGSLEAPWQPSQVSEAAWVLQRELACAMRPAIRTRLVLDWDPSATLPDPLSDALHHTRHLLANYGEIGLGDTGVDYRVSAELVAFQGDTWQLILRALPQQADLAPLDAVTYFSLPGYVPAAPIFRPPLQAPSVARADRGAAFDHLQVELIDALQGKASRSRAALEVKFRLSNTSPWPIDYAFSLSGGHYQHCVPEAAYYRHDRYGYVEGRLEAGESLIRHMVIEGARHNPNPWFGPRRCAGFRSLEGFEDFSGKGRSVTQFVRWAMI